MAEIIANLRDRIQKAKLNGWPSEVAGLETSMQAASQKLVSLDRHRGFGYARAQESVLIGSSSPSTHRSEQREPASPRRQDEQMSLTTAEATWIGVGIGGAISGLTSWLVLIGTRRKDHQHRIWDRTTDLYEHILSEAASQAATRDLRRGRCRRSGRGWRRRRRSRRAC
ncbi:hypothetical protein ACIRSS_23785 [Amycolatopsis sp. NPDC101161]|uniref:hypothetical protein n=1 Tax=Amycolatopsis sp. NPDC101161 TaxID=3363940 RepID=UPI00383058E6